MTRASRKGECVDKVGRSWEKFPDHPESTAMNLGFRMETAEQLDPVLTSSLARKAFGKSGPELSADRFSWSYRHGYEETVIMSAFADDAKVGQLVCLFKTVVVSGQKRIAAEFVDLFVTPEFRGFKVASGLYKEMQTVIRNRGADVLYAYANEGASVLNRRFFGMEDVTQLPARIGFRYPLSGTRSAADIAVHQTLDAIASACADCAGSEALGGVELTRDKLLKRIGSPVTRYVCATDGDLAVLASPRMIRSVSLLLICATFSRQGASPSKRSMAAIVDSLCRTAGRHVFLYVGWNDAIGWSTGFGVPERLLKGKFLIQSNCLNSQREGIGRFEMLDVDYG
jgi:GNAT superfamily N-acetyltransferase